MNNKESGKKPPRWHTILMEAVQDGRLQAEDIPTHISWKRMVIELDNQCTLEPPNSFQLVGDIKMISTELCQHLSRDVEDISYQRVQNLFATLQVTLYIAAALREDIDLDLAAVDLCHLTKEYLNENSSNPLTD